MEMNIPILAREVGKAIFSKPRTNFPIYVVDFHQAHFPSLSGTELEEALLQLEADGLIQLEKDTVENFAGTVTDITKILGY